ncbi:uncharacterized protein LOC115061332 [Echeneis naucrates]|uniref:OTU deubiquitinase with linear linkage specificity a n=1 Tax=Echeneis naucrates TaxID=173247 RepID=A0A665W611_ECHNA|nr:ubiquitin thioesterase otulin [Echeneis naucrates]
MGNCCFQSESPCGSAEERSVLLEHDSKATVSAGVIVVEGTCGPDGDENMGKKHDVAKIKEEEKAEAVQVKQSSENGESEPNNAQENGPLKKESVQTATPSKEETATGEQEHMEDSQDNTGQAALLQCTLKSHQKYHAAADWEAFTETNVTPEQDPASVEDRIPDGISQIAESVCPEKPSFTETTTTAEHIIVKTSHDDKTAAGSSVTFDDAATEPSGEFSQNNQVLPVPNTQVDAAACQVFPVPEVSQGNNTDILICAVTEDSDNGSSSASQQAFPENIKSHAVSESSPGSEPAGFSREECDSANSVPAPEAAPPADACESPKSGHNENPDSTCSATSLKEVASLEELDIGEEMMLKEQKKDGDVAKMKEDDVMKEENAPLEMETGNDAGIQELTGEEEQLGGGDDDVVLKKKRSNEGDLENSDEDLYRGAEELSQNNKPGPPSVFETTSLKVEDRCSLTPAVDILSYSEREWKGNTAKSALIRKGYKEMSQRFGSLRRVRGDNYCALRATLFQVLSHSTRMPAWLQEEEDITVLLKQLEAQEGLISQWTFPGVCVGDGAGDVVQQLKGYMELLRNKWQAAVDCPSDVERQQLCEQVFQGGEEELGLLEALKLLMLGRAVELHNCMQCSGDVPLFCWLLFARDSSDCPHSFLSNHLRHVGLSAGLEQVEMFLLGYALQCTIEVYRLYKADTEEFVTYYPDDHKNDWPSVCLVTEDDRHYNVPITEAAELHRELNSS